MSIIIKTARTFGVTATLLCVCAPAFAATQMSETVYQALNSESGDKVVVHSTIEGTQASDFASFPSKGQPFKIMAGGGNWSG